MKRLIAILVVLVLLPLSASAELYILFGNVIDLEYDTDCVTVDDGYGNLWEFYGVDFYFYGDLVVMYMSDNDTPDWIYDDYVTNAYKCTAEEAQEIISEYRESMRSRMTPGFLDLFKFWNY